MSGRSSWPRRRCARGSRAVLATAGIGAGDLASVFVAGAFGSALETRDLVDLGVFPLETADVVHSVGNAALEGAAVIALDPTLLDLAVSLAVDVRHVDLAGDPGFAAALMEATELAEYTLRG